MVISKDDFDKLNDRIRHYMDWSFYSIQYLTLKELHEAFLESFLNTAKLNKDKKVDFLDDVFENDIAASKVCNLLRGIDNSLSAASVRPKFWYRSNTET